ncbi:type I secretion system permease/ATPase [Aquamicrobium soli]|jgi:PrtD family type I secretion system ABC transporter|uniref:Type I secretion system permease/ATPase n=1 Tax=Aquamicrobium soli TaxID=1811518 RepID=A0ABV7KDH7_9HYPH
MAQKQKSDELRHVSGACRGYFVVAALFSLAMNLLYLAAPIYMLQVYDRVVSSGSETTLVMLTVALLAALAALAGLDTVRARVLNRVGVRLDRLLAGRVVSAMVEKFGGMAFGAQLLRDFDAFRQFITGTGIHAIFDLPWAPIYILVIFLLHPLLGFFALGSVVVLVVMMLANEWLVREPQAEAGTATSKTYGFTDMSLRNAEVIQAMGMTEGLLQRWGRDRARMVERQATASDRAATMHSVIKFLRMAMQSLILGLGAYLVINRMASAGAMFAASLLLGRALQPVEQTVGQWRALVSARSAYFRVRDLLLASPPAERSLILPRPKGSLSAENLHFMAPGNSKLLLRNVSFRLEAGDTLGVIGVSGAGKSTLARLIVGVCRPSGGVVRLDGADIWTWPRESAGRYIGYLPQDIELFADTVAANISRFRTGMDAEVIRAARMAGVHEMILRLPDGYETQVGEGGAALSGGYRQRIALARAVFDRPALVVLDEPSSNLDATGDQALTDCILQLKQQGTTVVIISHRPATIAAMDKILILRDGAVDIFGDRAEVLAKLGPHPHVRAVPSIPQAEPAAAGG